MNAIVSQEAIRLDATMASVGGGAMLAPRSLGEIVDFSKLMCRAGPAIPKHLRENPGACMAVTMQALRWEMDPFAVANKSYFVNDRVAYEAQLVAAVVTTRAPIQRRPTYTFTGEGPAMTCTIVATFDDGTVQSYTSPRFGDITTKNSPLWKSDPQQQLGYFSIRSWARRYCPEVILGVYDREELESLKQEPMKNVTPRNPLLPSDPTPIAEAEETAAPLPFLERFADALGLATTLEEVQQVLDIYDSEIAEQNVVTQDAVRITVNAKQKDLAKQAAQSEQAA